MINKSIKALKALIKTPKNILIIGHKNPDGDAVGSCMGWAMFLENLGHETNVVMPNEYPDFLNWVPQQENIVLYSKEKERVRELIQESDLIFTLDFNHLSRVGNDFQEDLEAAEKSFVMIDHHQQPDDYAEIMISDADYGSTAELVYHCIDKMEYTGFINKDIASCLYLGIMTDTGSFKFSSTTAGTHRIAANLIENGAESSKIQQQTFDSNSYSSLKLLGLAMKNLEYLPELKTAYIHLSHEELDGNNFKKGDTEGFVNYGLSIKDVVFAAIFKEDLNQNIVKISLRSKGEFDVNQFARKHFEGGGHKNAAGGKSDLSLNDTIEKFVNLLDKYKTQLDEAL